MKKTHPTFFRDNPDECRKLLKDFVTAGGDWSSSDLSPAIREDPVLQQQCRDRGYMIIQLGDQIRQVYCGSPTDGHDDLGSDCPQCGTPMCIQHLSEHLGANLIDPTSLQIGQPASPGENPNPYLSAPPGVDTRPNMSTWDNAELNRNRQLKALIEDRKTSSLTKAMWRHIHKAEDRRRGGWIQKGVESSMSPKEILALDPVSRLVFEIEAYSEEYKAPASTADIATELATRGIDQKFQDQLDQVAHSSDNWLPEVLEELAARGLIDKSQDGGWIPKRKTK